MTDASSDTFTFATEDGLLAYRDTGSGRPVVLLHGGFLDHHMWDDQVPAFTHDYRVIAPDTRGHGGSANASRPFRWADDLAALLRHLDLGPAVLVGVSMGATIAVDTALEYPDLVRALVISGGGTLVPELHEPWAKATADAQYGALAVGDIQGWTDAFLLWAAGPQREIGEVDPAILGRVREMAWRTLSKHSVGEVDHLVPVLDAPARAKELTVPVLAVNGALDAPELAGLAEHVARSGADGRVTVVEGAAHYPNLEQPEAFNRIVGDFLRTVHA